MLYLKQAVAEAWVRASQLVMDADESRVLHIDNADVTFARARFAPTGGKALSIGVKAPASVTLYGGEVDGSQSIRGGAALIDIARGSRLTAVGTRFSGAPRIYVNQQGDFTARGCRFGPFGRLAVAADHLEACFTHAGRVLYDACEWDMRPTWPVLANTLSALVMFKSDGGPVDATLTGGVIDGDPGLPLNYAIQAGAVHPMVLRIGGMRLRRYRSGYVGLTGPVDLVDLGGNVDAETGEGISVLR